jgi:hypothetical protein
MAPRKSTTTKTPSKRAGTSKAEIGSAAPISGDDYQPVLIQDSEWQKMFNILGFSSVEQG